MMPVLVVLTVIIAGYGLTVDGAIDGLIYYVKPSMENFSGMTVIAAMGQLFYSMSLAMGIMITYGSYMKKIIIWKVLFAKSRFLIPVLHLWQDL